MRRFARAGGYFVVGLAALSGCARQSGPIQAVTSDYLPLRAGASWNFVRADGSSYSLTAAGPVTRAGESAWRVDRSGGASEFYVVRSSVVLAEDAALAIPGLWYQWLQRPPVSGNRWDTAVPVNGPSGPGTFSYVGAVRDAGEQTTPAGRFSQCFELTVDAAYDLVPSPGAARAHFRFVLAPGVGWIEREVSTWDAAGGALVVDAARLASYAIP